MKAFREERNTMHTKRAVHWVSSVAVLAATALGLSAPLATSAAAAGSETITAVAEQPRYPINANAVFDVTVANPNVGDQLSLTVNSGPDATNPTTTCTTISNTGTATCHLLNTGGAGTDQVTVSDPNQSAVSPQTPVTFETITAVANSNVGSVNSPIYLYGAGETATVTVTVHGGGSTPALKALVTSGPDAGTFLACNTPAPGTWTCTLLNGGQGGADAVTIFDDDNPSGTTGQVDQGEAQTSLTINFEALTAAPQSPRAQTQTNGTATINVAVSGKPAGWTPKLKELVTNAQFSSAGVCTDGNPGTDTSWTCTVTNSGRPDSATVRIFDDLNSNNSPDSVEPTVTTTVNFEQLTATDTNAPHSVGSTAVISVTPAGVPTGQTPSIDYEITCGPDGPTVPPTPPATTPTTLACPASNPAPQNASAPVVHVCAGSTPATCNITNNGTGGTDGVTFFDDANNNGVFDGNAGEPNTTKNVIFGRGLAATPLSSEEPSKDANNPGSGVATINVVMSTQGPTDIPHVRFTVTNGPDAGNANDTSVACAPQNGGTVDWVCTVPNPVNPTSTTGHLDTVVVYDDLNCNATCSNETGNNSNLATLAMQPAMDPQQSVKVQWDTPTSINLTPTLAPNQTQNVVALGGCQIYTLTVNPTVKFPVSIIATQDLGAGTNAKPAPSLSTCNVPNGSVNSASGSVANAPGGIPFVAPGDWTDTLTVSGFSNSDPAHPGQFIIGLTSNSLGKDGSVVVHAATTLANTGNNVTSPNQTMNVIKGGQATVHTLTVSPSSVTIGQGDSVPFKVLVQDANGTPLPGTTIDYFVSAGSPDATTKAVTCIAADQFGNASCGLTNNRNVGLDHLIFFAPQVSGETTPAANDPQTPATVTVQAVPPAGSTLTFGCPDELLSDANQIVPACTVSTTNGNARQVIFAAHVADASNAPLANIPVTFTLGSAPSGATATATQVNSNAKGNALFVVSVPSPAAGDKITVTATVGNPAQGGLGPDTATATFQAPHPATVSITPHSQQVAAGGLVSVTAKVGDQFGVGVAGQGLSWAVSGRNSQSGNATTGTSGTTTISYPDAGGSGSDTITVLDVAPNAPSGAGSNNPATAVVTFGSTGGCTTNCGGGGQTERPTMSVTQRPAGHGEAKLTLIVTSRPKLVNAKVIFYQITRSGARHQIGTGVTGPRGKVTGTLKAAVGLHLRFQAKVIGRAGVRSGFSNIARINVI